MKTKICRYCKEEFQPSRYHPDQTVCGAEVCQNKRQNDYRKLKLSLDTEYLETCRNSRKKWRMNNPDYMRAYRAERRQADRDRQERDNGS